MRTPAIFAQGRRPLVLLEDREEGSHGSRGFGCLRCVVVFAAQVSEQE